MYYWKEASGKEVDFVVTDRMEVKQLIQVCYDIDDILTTERAKVTCQSIKRTWMQ